MSLHLSNLSTVRLNSTLFSITLWTATLTHPQAAQHAEIMRGQIRSKGRRARELDARSSPSLRSLCRSQRQLLRARTKQRAKCALRAKQRAARATTRETKPNCVCENQFQFALQLSESPWQQLLPCWRVAN